MGRSLYQCKKFSRKFHSFIIFIQQKSLQPFLTETDVGKPRNVSFPEFKKLALRSDSVKLIEEEFSTDLLLSINPKPDIVINCGFYGFFCPKNLSLDQFCRQNSMKFLSAEMIGLLGSIFVDFGDCHTIQATSNSLDYKISSPIHSISFLHSNSFEISTEKSDSINQGDLVQLFEYKGEFSFLNNIYTVVTKRIGKDEVIFSMNLSDEQRNCLDKIKDFPSRGGGYIKKLPRVVEMNFVRLFATGFE